MNALDTQTTVGALVTERPARARVFESHGIDFCCGGKVKLSEACARKKIDVDQVVRELAEADAAALEEPSAVDWSAASLADLIDHIIQTHHEYLRKEMPRLTEYIAKVVEVHGDRHPDLKKVKSIFSGMRQELEAHMMKEEQILFPCIRMLEESAGVAQLPFGTVENPIRMMILEHENAGDALERLRSLTNGYTPPEDACNTYRATLDGLKALEADLHIHIHKENNILFPRAIELEAAGD